MRIAYRLIFIVLLAAIVWQGYAGLESKRQAAAAAAVVSMSAQPQPDAPGALTVAGASSQADGARFSCDGRTVCTQMRSCEEAKYFLKNCPNTKMDGNHDGIPCQIQWCR